MLARPQAERIAAARAAADAADVPLFVNARIDTLLRGAGGVEETLERAAAFLTAGADGVFVPGAVDPLTVQTLVEGVEGPLNILVGPGAPSVDALAALGVARISAGSSIAEAAYALVRRAARELLGTGTYETLTYETLTYETPTDGLDYAGLNALMGRVR